MTADATILFCPKCGERYRGATPSLDISKRLTCVACSQSFGIDELRTASDQARPDQTASEPFPAIDDDQGPTPIKILLCVIAALVGAIVASLFFKPSL
jgi:hypothetical protein